MIHNKIKHNSAINGVANVFPLFSPFPWEIMYSNKRFVRTDVISRKKSVSSDVTVDENEAVSLYLLF